MVAVAESGTSVAILGAGFSRTASFDTLPLMQDFFVGLDANRYRELAFFVETASRQAGSANVEELLVLLDQIQHASPTMFDHWSHDWYADSAVIQRQLEDYVISRLHRRFFPVNWALEIVRSFKSSVTTISMNYDTLAERVLSNRPGLRHRTPNTNCPHCRMRQLLQCACNCDDRRDLEQCDWQGALIKLHGSIAWMRCGNRDCCLHECLVADEHCGQFSQTICPNCAVACRPVIVMPTMSKRLNEIPQIKVMWDAARGALKAAHRILLFGFSLPKSDGLLTMMLRESFALNSQLKHIACIDLYPVPVLERIQRCVPEGVDVHYHPLQVVRGQKADFYSTLRELGFTEDLPVMPMSPSTGSLKVATVRKNRTT